MNVVIIGDFPEESKVKIHNSFPADWRVQITSPADALSCIAEADVIIPEHIRVGEDFLAAAPKLKLVQTGAGYDNVDIKVCTARGVQVCNAAGVNSQAVAEHAMALILCFYKNIAYLDSFIKSRRPMDELSYEGAELSGKTIGIIGLGNAGSRLAALCNAFGMNVLGYSRSPAELPDVRQVGLDTLYRESDIISLHVPLTDATRHMINSQALAQMKSGALLVNTSRGAVINEAELVDALKNRSIGGACLDVFEQEPIAEDNPLRSLPNVILTPHTAGLPDGVKFHQKRYEFFVSNISAVMRGETPQCALNTVPPAKMP